MGRRILRYLVIGLVLLMLGGLWAFSFFLFNPFEGSYDYPIASLVPREVDFYLSKGRLSGDFRPFPHPVIEEAFESSPAGKAILDLGLRQRLADWKVESSLAELDAALAQLPVHVDPLALFGGKDLAVAGHFTGATLAEADWAVYGRANWMGKLGVELVAGDWLDLSAQGLQVEPFENEGEKLGVRLSGGQLTRPLFLARIHDVVIVATQGQTLVAAKALEGTRGQDSLDRSAKYTDNIVRTGEEGDELEVYLDQRALAENLKFAGTWPDPRSRDLGPALAARLFQVGAVREVIGTLDFARAVTVDLVGELSSNVLSPFQQRLYDERGFDKDLIQEAARLAPSDVGFFAYLHADPGDLMRELRSVVSGLDPAAITNLEDFVHSAWNYPDLEPLINDIDTALRDRVAVFVRQYDYPPEVGDRVPPHDDTPVFAWAIVLWPENQAKIDAIRRVIESDNVVGMLRIQGATAGSSGLWENTLQGGAKIKEYWNVLVPGTGHIATLEMKGREPYLVISNENRLLGQIFKVYNTGRTEEGLTPLAEDPAYATWVKSGLGSANLLAWFAPRKLEKTSRLIAAREAQEGGADAIDWNVERPRIEREVLAKNFPGETWGRVSEENQNAFEMLVQQEADRFQARYLEERLPALRAESERWLRALSAIDGAFFELSTDRKRMHLHGRVGLEFQGTTP